MIKVLKKIILKIKSFPFRIWAWKHNLDAHKISVLGGYPLVYNRGDLCILGGGKLIMVNNAMTSTLGINRKCKINLYKNARLTIKGIVSMSNTVIVATKEITIGDNVMIGGGVTIVDSDFHTMDYSCWNTPDDEKLMKKKPVSIGNNVFIGMNSIILKGCIIGDGSIIAAGSVVCNNIPPGEIWGGNPAKRIGRRSFDD